MRLLERQLGDVRAELAAARQPQLPVVPTASAPAGRGAGSPPPHARRAAARAPPGASHIPDAEPKPNPGWGRARGAPAAAAERCRSPRAQFGAVAAAGSDMAGYDGDAARLRCTEPTAVWSPEEDPGAGGCAWADGSEEAALLSAGSADEVLRAEGPGEGLREGLCEGLGELGADELAGAGPVVLGADGPSKGQAVGGHGLGANDRHSGEWEECSDVDSDLTMPGSGFCNAAPARNNVVNATTSSGQTAAGGAQHDSPVRDPASSAAAAAARPVQRVPSAINPGLHERFSGVTRRDSVSGGGRGSLGEGAAAGAAADSCGDERFRQPSAAAPSGAPSCSAVQVSVRQAPYACAAADEVRSRSDASASWPCGKENRAGSVGGLGGGSISWHVRGVGGGIGCRATGGRPKPQLAGQYGADEDDARGGAGGGEDAMGWQPAAAFLSGARAPAARAQAPRGAPQPHASIPNSYTMRGDLEGDSALAACGLLDGFSQAPLPPLRTLRPVRLALQHNQTPHCLLSNSCCCCRSRRCIHWARLQ